MRLRELFHSQSGRSLVEILAVLAIMGVLSLMGILGIQYAMEKNRENETLNRFSKVVAGSRTSRILQNLGDATTLNLNTGEELEEYEPQPVNMNDVISNLGDDLKTDYILAPLEGPADANGTKKKVEIYVNVQTPEAFTVHAENLTVEACMKIVRADLGYTFVYESKEKTTDWQVPPLAQTEEGARKLCNDVVYGLNASSGPVSMQFSPFIRQAVAATPAQGTPGTLVMWFGTYACKKCLPPSCAGASCCCEFSEDGRTVKLTSPAPSGCKAVSGQCVPCATPDAQGICVPKPGMESCKPSCSVNICTDAQKPFYCGDGVCCVNQEDCGSGKCKGVPVVCNTPERPTACGTKCCAKDEQCMDGVCEPIGKCNAAEQTCYDTSGQFENCCGLDEVCCEGSCCVSGEICNAGVCEQEKCTPLHPKYCGKDVCCSQNEQCHDGKCIPACPNGQVPYCIEEEGRFTSAQSQDCEVYGTECKKYGCAPLFPTTTIVKDPTMGQGRRALEFLVKGLVYPYCAKAIDGKCSVVSYCDVPPKPSKSSGMVEICPSCMSDGPSNNFDVLKNVCVGSTIKAIPQEAGEDGAVGVGAAQDGVDALMHYSCEGTCVNPCEGGRPVAGGCCMPPNTAWSPCTSCEAPPTTNICGQEVSVAEICCGSTNASPGCTNPGKAGKCLTNYPVNGSCCPLAGVDENGQNECCDDCKDGKCGGGDTGENTDPPCDVSWGEAECLAAGKQHCGECCCDGVCKPKPKPGA